MEVRVEFDELEILTRSTDQSKSELEIEINKMLDSLERMKTMWQGQEADIFYEKAFEYITRMKVMYGFMNASNDLIKTGNIQYQRQDQSFSNDLKKEVVDYEPDNTEF